jgi:hypothetical protein
MDTKFVEAVTKGSQFNWGKFMVCRHVGGERDYRSRVDEGRRLLSTVGSHPRLDIWVLDLQTGEGVRLTPHPESSARADLNEHKVWVCPLFEPFVKWLYTQDLTYLGTLPALVELEAEPAFAGYRRPGVR